METFRTITVRSWNGFLRQIHELEKPLVGKTDGHISRLLYRGHADARWSLDTTLERYGFRGKYMFSRYFAALQEIKAEIETRTGRTWELPLFPDYLRQCYVRRGSPWLVPLSGDLYKYMTYLRHHGFPSPLLDWTTSPYVAAHFAFRECVKAKHVAVFIYQEFAGEAKVMGINSATIHVCGPHVTTHLRHILQQSQYTICYQIVDEQLAYVNHEEELVSTQKMNKQDLLWKICMPISCRDDALNYLRQHGITDYSLFGSEESLVRTLAEKCLVDR